MGATAVPQPDLLAINGINGATGETYGKPVSPAALGAAVLSEFHEPELAQALRGRAAAAVRHFAVRANVDATSLSEAGWGAIFPYNCPAAVIDNLKPLLELRRSQAGDRFRTYTGINGYRPGDSVLRFLARQGMGPGQANPDKVPYYLLLVGGPEQIPLSFQYRLDVDYAVGRLAFEQADEYARYAESIAEQERAAAPQERKAVLFSVANPGDEATNRSDAEMMDPLGTRAEKWTNGWTASLVRPAQATRRHLGETFHGPQAPRIFFSASHGVGFPAGDPLQERRQGAILCEDWPGPFQHKGPLPQDWYFSGEDLDAAANVKGTVAFLFACYGGGTPACDYFPETAWVSERRIAPRDFIAHLPCRMLSHERGSARAVVAHVERVWTYSFSWPKAGPQIEIFEDMLRLLTAGAPLGFAMEAFGQKYASLNTDISDIINLLRDDPTLEPDPQELGRLWTARNDARSFVILGDPAVRAG